MTGFQNPKSSECQSCHGKWRFHMRGPWDDPPGCHLISAEVIVRVRYVWSSSSEEPQKIQGEPLSQNASIVFSDSFCLIRSNHRRRHAVLEKPNKTNTVNIRGAKPFSLRAVGAHTRKSPNQVFADFSITKPIVGGKQTKIKKNP